MDKKKKSTYGIMNNILYMAKSIWRFEKAVVFLLGLSIMVQLGASLLGIYIPKIIVDSIEKMIPLHYLVIFISVIALLLYVFEKLSKYSGDKLYVKCIMHRVTICNKIMMKTLNTDMENITNSEGQTKKQKALEAVSSNIAGTEAIVHQSSLFIKNVIGIVIYGMILATLNSYILLILIVGAVINYLVSKGAVAYEHKHKDDYAPIDEKLFHMREQTVRGEAAKDIRIYSMAQWLIAIYKGLIKERFVWSRRIELHNYIPNVVDAVIVFLRDGIAYAYLVSRVLSGLPVGDFLLYFGAITGFSIWLSGATNEAVNINRSALQIEDVRSFLDMKDKTNREPGIKLPSIDRLPCSLELKGVSYKYPDSKEYVLCDMNLKVGKGEKLAIVGGNGAGKTTIVKLICGLIHPTSGEVLLDGKPLGDYNIDEYRSMFSVAFQDAFVLSFKISENISMLPDDITDKDKLRTVIELSGLWDKVESLKDGTDSYINNIFVDNGVELSGGEKQKMILARALYKNSHILILDEPTAALDPIAESELYEKYADFSREKTSIYISHRLASTRFCDRIVFIKDGGILESGSHNELMKLDGEYANMFEVQSHYYKRDLEVGA